VTVLAGSSVLASNEPVKSGITVSAVLTGPFQPKLVTVLLCRTSWLSFLRYQLNDVMNYVILHFARRLVPGQNYPDYAIFDFDHITDFELRFVRSASKSLALWFVLHLSILPQHD
jgi:hypothetical protein